MEYSSKLLVSIFFENKRIILREKICQFESILFIYAEKLEQKTLKTLVYY